MGRRFALAFSLLGCALSLSSPSVMAGERIVSIGPATTELILALGASRAWSPPMSAVRSPEACPRSAITAPSPPKGS